MGTYWKAFWRAALIRAIRTFAQALVATIPVGIAITQVGWPDALGIAATAAVLSILTSLATKLPEVDGDEDA